MKIRFYLRKSTKKYSINFEYRSSNGSIRYRTSTGYMIQNSKEWDNKKERLKIPSSVFGATDINTKLSEAIFKFNKSISVIDELNISESDIQKIVLNSFGKMSVAEKEKVKTESNKNNLISYYKWFLEYYSIHNSPYTKKKLAKGTLKTYKTGLSRLEEYIADRKLKNFSFKDCNREFYNDYILYLTSLNYSKNYVGTIIQKLKTILGFAYEEGIHSNNEFKKSYFSKMTEEIDHVYLTVEELKRIKELQLNDTILDNVRDVFLISCYTGLRISDMMALLKRSNHVIFEEDGVKYFQLKQLKTTNSVIIPLNSIVNAILDKRNGSLPNYLHSTIINEHIKSICKRAKIIENHSLTRTIGGKVEEFNLPKYKLVSSHTARRSFCTNAFKSGIPIQDIMAISGHKSERVFLNYVKVQKVENAKRIAKHEFFR
jgi:integrase